MVVCSLAGPRHDMHSAKPWICCRRLKHGKLDSHKTSITMASSVGSISRNVMAWSLLIRFAVRPILMLAKDHINTHLFNYADGVGLDLPRWLCSRGWAPVG